MRVWEHGSRQSPARTARVWAGAVPQLLPGAGEVVLVWRARCGAKHSLPERASVGCLEESRKKDLNTSQTRSPQTSVPDQGSIQLPQVDELLLNHQPESLEDAESGARVEEKIVYL
ncbi:hypothetical protein DV515_00005215 [Chloebia gouldiae]|uniref:Uncharacterized protein n=1 Tax=Chloebia gouldiae TaxID=44316 RepID=A0A3L8SN88_CHLGU|nr:hypothetical protein DV515_00005215 [Chloebia gouldiae]